MAPRTTAASSNVPVNVVWSKNASCFTFSVPRTIGCARNPANFCLNVSIDVSWHCREQPIGSLNPQSVERQRHPSIRRQINADAACGSRIARPSFPQSPDGRQWIFVPRRIAGETAQHISLPIVVISKTNAGGLNLLQLMNEHAVSAALALGHAQLS